MLTFGKLDLGLGLFHLGEGQGPGGFGRADVGPGLCLAARIEKRRIKRLNSRDNGFEGRDRVARVQVDASHVARHGRRKHVYVVHTRLAFLGYRDLEGTPIDADDIDDDRTRAKGKEQPDDDHRRKAPPEKPTSFDACHRYSLVFSTLMRSRLAIRRRTISAEMIVAMSATTTPSP